MIDRLACDVQTYAWGHPRSIPDLLGTEPSGEPQAEMWIGAHPKAPSRLVGSGIALNDAIDADPLAMIGPQLAASGSRLPFLAKFLAAGQPLSIQVHPTLTQAQVGFGRENDEGVALADPLRTYRDDNHKPEMVVALGPFSALCGFRPLAATINKLRTLDLPALDPLLSQLRADPVGAPPAGASKQSAVLGSTMQWALALDEETVATMVTPLLDPASVKAESGFEWLPEVANRYPRDAGVLVGLLLNQFTLQAGEAIFLPAGNVHAYISGFAVEIMANSDNVIRCGWTPKNVDVPELLSVASFEPIEPPIQQPSSSWHRYEADVPEFSLVRAEIQQANKPLVFPRASAGPEIVFVTEGEVTLTSNAGRQYVLKNGQPLFLSADEGSYSVRGNGLLWSATPNHQHS